MSLKGQQIAKDSISIFCIQSDDDVGAIYENNVDDDAYDHDECAMSSNNSTREKVMIAARSTNDSLRLEMQTWCRMQTLNILNIFVKMRFLLLQDTSN